MSPRSKEFLVEAGKRLRLAQASLELDDPAGTVSLAYYAMLYASRAALSERDLYARTHVGVWNLFRREFGDHAELAGMVSLGPETQELREAGDYQAKSPSARRARRAVEDAERLVRAVERTIGG